MKYVAAVFGVIVLALGLMWAVQGNAFFIQQAFAPRQEAVRREVFKESQAYNDGMAQELDAMRFEYVKAAPEHKAALASVILHRAASYEIDRLPSELRSFVEKLRAGRGAQ